MLQIIEPTYPECQNFFQSSSTITPMTPSSTVSSLGRTDLAPKFTIPIGLITAAMPLIFVQRWIGLGIALLGIFLTLQAVIIKLSFTTTDLEVYRSGKLIRSFPYADWQHWQIFWEPVPILFYFKEVKSIHFLPIIFDPRTLKTCLEHHCPLQNLRSE